MRLVLIEWVDSFGCASDWTSLADSRAAPLLCRSVGWLLHDTEACKVLVPHVTNPTDPDIAPQGCGDMTIPTCAVTRMIDLPLDVPMPLLPGRVEGAEDRVVDGLRTPR